MHTKETDVKHNPNASKAKDIEATADKKGDGSVVAAHSADKAKELMMPGASTDVAMGSCGGVGKDGKPMHMAACNCASKSASQAATDNNGGHKVKGESADHAASTMNAKKDTAVPTPPTKAPEKQIAHP